MHVLIVIFLPMQGCDLMKESDTCTATVDLANATDAQARMLSPLESVCGSSEGCSSKGSFYKGAEFAQGHIFFRTSWKTFMNMWFMLFGAVNFPDVAMPAVITNSEWFYYQSSEVLAISTYLRQRRHE